MNACNWDACDAKNKINLYYYPVIDVRNIYRENFY